MRGKGPFPTGTYIISEDDYAGCFGLQGITFSKPDKAQGFKQNQIELAFDMAHISFNMEALEAAAYEIAGQLGTTARMSRGDQRYKVVSFAFDHRHHKITKHTVVKVLVPLVDREMISELTLLDASLRFGFEYPRGGAKGFRSSRRGWSWGRSYSASDVAIVRQHPRLKLECAPR